MLTQKTKIIPKYVWPYLWSYNIKKIDLENHKKRIITNVLNLGSKRATDWLFRQYNKEDIKKLVINPLPGEWNKKSLNFWSLIMRVKSKNSNRKIK